MAERLTRPRYRRINTRPGETQYEALVRETKAMSPYGFNGEVTPTMLLMTAIGMDWTQDVLILCDKCGITYDPECDYGGWHTDKQWMVLANMNVEPFEPKI